MPPLWTLSDVAEAFRQGSDPLQLLRVFSDSFIAKPSPDRIASEPALAGEPWFDVFLAGLAEFFARQVGSQPPAWTDNHPVRFLAQPLMYDPPINLAITPAAFRRRLLFCGDAILPLTQLMRCLHDGGR